jgi:hypothetical protein
MVIVGFGLELLLLLVLVLWWRYYVVIEIWNERREEFCGLDFVNEKLVVVVVVWTVAYH